MTVKSVSADRLRFMFMFLMKTLTNGVYCRCSVSSEVAVCEESAMFTGSQHFVVRSEAEDKM